jgi:acyl carrier protein
MKKSREEIIDVMESLLNVDKGVLTLSTHIGDIEEWDSLGHLSILSGLDKIYKGSISSISNIAGAGSVKDILDILSDNDLIE